jgi:hypothetical protein
LKWRGEFTGVTAHYREPQTGLERSVTTGDPSKAKRLRWLYATDQSARRAMKRKMGKDAEKINVFKPAPFADSWPALRSLNILHG